MSQMESYLKVIKKTAAVASVIEESPKPQPSQLRLSGNCDKLLVKIVAKWL